MLDFLIKFFALIGLIILIVYVINYFVTYFKQQAALKANQKIMPPPSYIQNNGIRCPDYFSNIGANKHDYECSNRDFNISINNPDKCYSNVNNKTVRFSLLPSGKTWELGNPNGLTTMTDQEKWDFVQSSKIEGNPSRCEWLASCGATENIQGVWQGIKRWCDMADPSQASM